MMTIHALFKYSRVINKKKKYENSIRMIIYLSINVSMLI